MKKQAVCFSVLFSLFLTGSIFLATANAQVRIKRKDSQAVQTAQTQKAPVPDRSQLLKEIVGKIASDAKTNAPAADPCSTATPITVGQTITGTLSSSSCKLNDGTFADYYSFNGIAGQPISVSLSSSAFDTYLYLLDANGNSVEENDDSGNGTDSRIPMDAGVITLPATGTYYIGVSSYSAGATGAYTVSLNTDAACAAHTITYNQTVSATLSSSSCLTEDTGAYYYTDLYTFSGTAGQQITIAENSTAFDAYLVLYTPSGANSVSDDDSGGGTNALIPTGSGTFTLPETGTYTIEATTSNQMETGAYTLILTGPTGTRTARTRFDFDGDGKADLAVFRPSNGTWYVQQSTNGFAAAQFGASTDLIVPADFDGDGKTDFAVYRGGTWYIMGSSTGFTAFQFGAPDDIPQPADFNGDGKADLAVFRPSNGTWYVYNLANNQFSAVAFGQSGDKPEVGDYDGDGKADYAVYRPSQGIWYLQQSTAGFAGFQFGAAEDKPVAADYDGDGKTDIAVFRNGTWYIQQSKAGFTAVAFGTTGDKPAQNAYVQ